MLRTKSQKRRLCSSCPIARVADQLGDPCSLLVIRDLMIAPRRFSELEDELGMSPRTLAKTLKRLERERFIMRESFIQPVRFRYRLTPKGRALRKVVDEMRHYGKKYL